MSIIKAIRQFRLFSVKAGQFQFNPGVFTTLVTIMMLYIMISLGFWQLDRAEFKEDLQRKIEHRKQLPLSTLENVPKSVENRRFYPVEIYGKFDAEHSFLLDNKILNGRVGYHVYTPVKLASGKAILINRGFIEMGATRSELPDVSVDTANYHLTGLIDKAPSRAVAISAYKHEAELWPVVLQHIDLAELSRFLGYELYDMVMWLNKNETGMYKYDMPVFNLNSAKNTGYAVQWFAMSMALFIIYIVVNTKRLKPKN